MLIRQPPTKSVVTIHTCDYHKRNPGKNYAGCTCSGSFAVVVKPMEEWTDEERRHYFGFYD